MNMPKHQFYMDLALVIALASHAERNKVGALLEKDGNIIAFGYNGTPAGFDNSCEEYQGNPIKLVTKPEVLHAESNAIAKCAKSAHSSEGCTLYVTVSPCLECAKLIIQAGIKEVLFAEYYRDSAGLELLEKAGIKASKA